MKKTIRLWYLYDFANSFASIVLIFYYPLMLTERGASDAWIGVSASIATGLLMLFLPYFGSWSDRTGQRICFIKIASMVMVASLFVMAFMMQGINSFSVLALCVLSFFYILFQVCFQGSYVFYSAMLRQITTTDNNAKVSGIGLGLGQLGNAVALAVIGPIIGTPLIIAGLNGKPLSLLLGGVLFAFISIPFFLQKDTKSTPNETHFLYKKFFRKIYNEKRIFYFILGYALLSDAILTFQLYVAIYIKRIFFFSDQLVTYAGITGLAFGLVGGFMANKLAIKLKDKEKALWVSAILYAFCFCLCAFIPRISSLVFISLAICGLAYGLLFSLARTVYSEISPHNEQAEFFSIFTVFERAASIVGPLLWLLIFFSLREFGENIQYRGSVLFLIIICLVGLYFLKKSRKYLIIAK